MATRRQRHFGTKRRAVLLGGAVAMLAAWVGIFGTAGIASAEKAAATLPTESAMSSTPTVPCTTLSTVTLPGLPGTDTATVTAQLVATSGCQVAIEITDTSDPRGGTPGNIGIDVTLPTTWNGNYMAEGNGVYCSPAHFVTNTTKWLASGYVISQDDCGHTGYVGPTIHIPGTALTSTWVTNSSPPPTLNWNRINDFGYLAQHLMAVESKALIGDYYKASAHYSYWNGCSTGGRQGMMEAQRYPTDFNGILAGAPAFNWDQFMVAQLWPPLVMKWNNDVLSKCKKDLVNTALRKQCPDQNGQIDGVFDPRNCDVLGILRSLIDTKTPCGTFTATDALVVQEIWQGPRYSGTQSDLAHGQSVWFGMEPGATFTGFGVIPVGSGGVGLATTQTVTGTQTAFPFIPSTDWFKNWIKQTQSWVWTDETYQQFWQDFQKSGQMFDSVLDANNPNLSSFQAAGGKLIMWQGLADQLIFTGGSINYYNQALRANGGIHNTQSFFRYFLAPGVGHCGTPGTGSIAPTTPMQQVITWVKTGHAPSVLNASGQINGTTVTRPLCPYPHPDAVYTGGTVNLASSYTCKNQVQFTNPALLNGQPNTFVTVPNPPGPHHGGHPSLRSHYRGR